MTRGVFEYDVAISFAGEDRVAAEELGSLLLARDIQVLYDEYREEEGRTGEPLDHLLNLYARKARYCVLLLSRHYPLQQWTRVERKALQERSLRDANEFIIPLRLDDIESLNAGDLRLRCLEGITALLEERLGKSAPELAPPSRSHDLRSGNLPSPQEEPGKE